MTPLNSDLFVNRTNNTTGQNIKLRVPLCKEEQPTWGVNLGKNAVPEVQDGSS